MNYIVLMDLGSALLFLAALAFSLTIPSSRIAGIPKRFLSLCMFIYILVGTFNVLEHSGITSHFDTIEDYLELLFMPSLLFFIYSHSIGIETKAREKAERALRLHGQIIDQTHDSVISTDMEGRITSWNRGAGRLYGYAAGEMLGRHISALYPEDRHALIREQIIAPLVEKGAHELDDLCLRKDGTLVDTHLSMSLIKDDSGTPTGMIGYSLDISERKRDQERIRSSLKEKDLLLFEIHHN